MPLFLIGLGLTDEYDITLKGLEAVRSSKRIYLEAYTSILLVSKDRLEALYGKELILADREMVESQADSILNGAETDNISFLVVGDPFGATTHTDLVLRAKERGIHVRTIHNASIMNAIGCCGLQLYHFGQTVSIPFFQDSWRPDSFYEKIWENRRIGLHTLCLLDIKVKEQSIENLLRGRKIYEPPRYMSINQCIEQLLEVEEKRQQGVLSPKTICVAVARVGSENQQIVAGTLSELLHVDFGEPLHSFVIAGRMHIIEAEYLRQYAVRTQSVDEYIAAPESVPVNITSAN